MIRRQRYYFLVLGGKANIPWKGAYSDIGSKTVKTNLGIVGKMEVILPIASGRGKMEME